MFRRLPVLVIVLSTTLISPALAVGEFGAGGWTGAAFFRDARFTHCGMLSRQGLWMLGLTIDEGGAVNLGLHHKDLGFTRHSRLRGSLQIDAGAATTHNFIVGKRNRLGTRLGSAEVQRMAQASRLKFRMGELAAEFSLAGLRNALPLLSACATRRGRK